MADPQSRTGDGYATAAILAYVDRLHAGHDAALTQAFSSPSRCGLPSIQLGPGEARLLGLLVRLLGARKVVEIGTLAGYSALHIARALPDDGRLWTLEVEPKHARVAEENCRAAGVQAKVQVLVGRALETLNALEVEAPFDVVFVDADKQTYPAYGNWARANLRPGGLLIADNVFYFGELLTQEPGAKAMRQFHEQCARDFDTCCVPTPDGLLIARLAG